MCSVILKIYILNWYCLKHTFEVHKGIFLSDACVESRVLDPDPSVLEGFGSVFEKRFEYPDLKIKIHLVLVESNLSSNGYWPK